MSQPALTDAPLLPQVISEWLSGRGWQLRPHQRAMIEKADTGRHALLIAPTGSGKTLAGFLPTLAELARHGPGSRLHTLYVAPLKALTVDVARNLKQPVKDMNLAVTIETRSGDTSHARKIRQRQTPPDILLTTPESLSLLLSYPDSIRLFSHLRRVVVDELHAFASTKRGQLLALSLSRLQTIAPNLQRFGLSATVNDEIAYREWLSPAGGRYHCDVIYGDDGPAPNMRILTPPGRIPWAGHTGQHAIHQVYEAITQHRTTLVFVNTRSVAELVFQALWQCNDKGLAIGLHHGSLAIERRRRVESAIARGQLRAVVCTSSLDLGIDWGDVDLVVQMGAPKGASRLLQRIGRSNHRADEPSKAILVPGNRFEYLEAQAALDSALAGELDGEPFGRGALDVMAQHLLSIACATPLDPALIFSEVRRAAPYAELSRSDFADTLAFVEHGGYALRRYNRYRRLIRDQNGRYRPANRQIAHRYRMNAGTIVTAPMIEVRYRNGRVLGTVEEWFTLGLRPGDSFVFAGQLLQAEGMMDSALIVRPAPQARDPRVTVYGGSRMPLTTHLANRVRAMLEDDRSWTTLPSDVRDWLRMQKIRSELPGRDGLLIETFPRGKAANRREYMVAYCFEGRNAHQTLGFLLTRRLEKRGFKPMGFVATDYVLGIWSLDPVSEPASLFSPDLLQEELASWMAESSMLKRSFREVSTISGLVERRHPGLTKSAHQLTVNSDLIYDVLRKYDPDHLLLRATWQDVGGRLTDLDRLTEFLSRIQGKLRHKALETVSPLAVPVLLEIGRESVTGEAVESLLANESELVAEAFAQ